MKSEFVTAITQLAAEKGVPREMVMEAIQQALVSAYKQHEEDSRLITAEIDAESGEPRVYHWLTVVEDIAVGERRRRVERAAHEPVLPKDFDGNLAEELARQRNVAANPMQEPIKHFRVLFAAADLGAKLGHTSHQPR